MKKIPTIFERDWDRNPQLVTRTPNPDCQWVFAGEGIATQKIDGTCCMVENGVLFRRFVAKPGSAPPTGALFVEFDPVTLHTLYWVPVGDGPEDQWHREAFSRPRQSNGTAQETYELIGPKIQGNPERVDAHYLVLHGGDLACEIAEKVPRTFDGLKAWLADHDMEGIVFHHPDGRMAKIKKRDFGLKRNAQ